MDSEHLDMDKESMDDISDEDFLKNLDNEPISNDFGSIGGGMGANMPTEQNLIEWQLDFRKDLDEIRLYLSGYREGYDEKGNWTYVPPKPDEEVPFNEYGVNVVMGHIRSYLNRNTVLSNYEQRRIQKILYDLGNKLGDEIEQTYEILGMDTDYKKRKFPLIVMNILHMVESAYNRAIRGGERESLRTARTVNQTEPMGNHRGMYNDVPRARKFKIGRPSTWI